MPNIMIYKGYEVSVEFDLGCSGTITIDVLNVKETLSSIGPITDTDPTLEVKRFIDTYLNLCEDLGEEPEQPGPHTINYIGEI